MDIFLEIDYYEAVIVRSLVSAKLTNCRSEFLLLEVLSIQVFDDDNDVVAWAAVVFTFKLRVECVFVVILASRVGAVHVDYAVDKELVLIPQPTHSFIDGPPPDYAFLHIARHY